MSEEELVRRLRYADQDIDQALAMRTDTLEQKRDQREAFAPVKAVCWFGHEAIQRLARERDEMRRALDGLTDIIRQHRCNSDGAMTVGECVESERCGCTVGLIIPHRALSSDAIEEKG